MFLQQLFFKTQAGSARLLDKLPAAAQKKLARRLGFPDIFPNLHPFLKCVLAIQQQQNQHHLISQNYRHDRKHFHRQMTALVKNPTPVKKVENIKLTLTDRTIKARRYHPHPHQALPTIVFYHGGGFIIGDLDTHDEACRLLAQSCQAQVISIDYPLAPEHSPHTVTQTCIEAFQYLHQNAAHFAIAPHRMAVAGDSAGGNLATVVSQALQHSATAPSAQLLLYPTVDFKSRHLSYHQYNQHLTLTEIDIAAVCDLYVTRHRMAFDDKMISPAYGDFSAIAPAYIVTAGHDILHDEGAIYAHQLRKAGIVVKYQDYADMTHGFIQLTPIFSTAKNYLTKIGEDFRQFWDLQK